MTRPVAIFLICAAGLAGPAAWAADRVPAALSTLPTPPGAKPVLELSVTDADLLPAIKQALPAIVGALPKILGMPEGVFLDPADADAIFGDVQALEALVAAVPPAGGKSAAPAVAQFYEDTLTKAGWRRLFWMQPGDNPGAQILIMSPQAEQGLFGLIAGRDAAGGGTTAIAIRMRGAVNIAPVIGRIVAWMATSHPAPPAPAPPKGK
jgi:hypothetical protein